MANDVVQMKKFEESQDPRVVVHILRTAEGRVEILSMEYTRNNVSNRTSFGAGVPVTRIFDKDVVHALSGLLAGVEGGSGVFSLPDFFVELPDVFLGGARVTSTERKGGEQSIIIRFQRFFGSLNTLFLPSVGFDTSIGTMTENLAKGIVKDIGLPLLSKIEAERVGVPVGTDPASALLAVHEKAKDLAKEIGLLNRHSKRTARSLVPR